MPAELDETFMIAVKGPDVVGTTNRTREMSRHS